METTITYQFVAAFYTDRVSLLTYKIKSYCLHQKRMSVIIVDNWFNFHNWYFSMLYLQNLIEIPSFYYRQWAPHYPPVVIFTYNGCSYLIKLRKDHSKYFFTDGLKQLRKEFNIQEGITITYAATDRDWIFNLHFMSPLDYQTYGGLPANRRTHVDVSKAMISAPHPLVEQLHSFNQTLPSLLTLNPSIDLHL